MKKKKQPVAACNECGKKFYTVKAAERAAFGARGCPKCGGSDIEPV
jgi:ssDNA-binding Zn-finger/Zn-ribbon topoisomerase 1